MPSRRKAKVKRNRSKAAKNPTAPSPPGDGASGGSAPKTITTASASNTAPKAAEPATATEQPTPSTSKGKGRAGGAGASRGTASGGAASTAHRRPISTEVFSMMKNEHGDPIVYDLTGDFMEFDKMLHGLLEKDGSLKAAAESFFEGMDIHHLVSMSGEEAADALRRRVMERDPKAVERFEAAIGRMLSESRAAAAGGPRGSSPSAAAAAAPAPPAPAVDAPSGAAPAGSSGRDDGDSDGDQWMKVAMRKAMRRKAGRAKKKPASRSADGGGSAAGGSGSASRADDGAQSAGSNASGAGASASQQGTAAKSEMESRQHRLGRRMVLAALAGEVPAVLQLLLIGAPATYCEPLGKDSVGLAPPAVQFVTSTTANAAAGCTGLIAVCRCASVSPAMRKQCVRAMLLAGAAKRIHAQGPDGSTALHHAAIRDDSQVVEMLLEAGAKPNARDYAGMTALHHAAFYNCASTIAMLMAKQADPARKDFSGKTPLHCAALGGSASAASALLSKSPASLSAQDDAGNTPLHTACSVGALTTVAVLALAQRGNVDARNGDHFTALHVAAAAGWPQCVRLLLERAGAAVHAVSPEGTAVEIADAGRCQAQKAADYGLKVRYDECVWLLSHHEEIKAANRGERSALVVSAAGTDPGGIVMQRHTGTMVALVASKAYTAPVSDASDEATVARAEALRATVTAASHLQDDILAFLAATDSMMVYDLADALEACGASVSVQMVSSELRRLHSLNLVREERGRWILPKRS